MVDSKENYRFDLEVKGLKSIWPEIIYKPWQRYISQKCQHEQHTRSTTTVFSTSSCTSRYEIEAVRKSLLSSETQNSTMPWSTTERIFGWMDEIRRQLGVVYKEDI